MEFVLAPKGKFWMGGSDRTVLLNNEASFNGDPRGNHYSPHLPDKGHAGIVFMHGSGTHVTARGNRCVGRAVVNTRQTATAAVNAVPCAPLKVCVVR